MPARSKFTAETRQRILEMKRLGASDRTAAAVAGIDHATLFRWLRRGEDAAQGSRFREFYEAHQAAEAEPRVRALAIVHDSLADNPSLAWKFLERREPGYAPPTASPPMLEWPETTTIHLTLGDGKPPPRWAEADMVPGALIDVGLPLPEGEPLEEA